MGYHPRSDFVGRRLARSVIGRASETQPCSVHVVQLAILRPLSRYHIQNFVLLHLCLLFASLSANTRVFLPLCLDSPYSKRNIPRQSRHCPSLSYSRPTKTDPDPDKRNTAPASGPGQDNDIDSSIPARNRHWAVRICPLGGGSYFGSNRGPQKKRPTLCMFDSFLRLRAPVEA